MDDAVRARDAAREALDDIEPERLHEVLTTRLTNASMTPAVLVLTSARALDPGVNIDGIVERAAGVQLIYEGLRLTRTLARDEPWADLPAATDDGDPSVDANEKDIAADIDVLAADVLVSRGFYLLARTDAATHAVETVRQFGRDQTRCRQSGADVDALDRSLEANVFTLAVVAGTTAVGGDPPASLLEYAETLAREYDGDLPPAAALCTETTADRIAALSADGHDDRVPSSATDG